MLGANLTKLNLSAETTINSKSFKHFCTMFYMSVIVVSGMPVCGSSTAAKKLAKKLRLKYFSVGKEFKKHMKGKETHRAIKMFNTKKGVSRSFHEELDNEQRRLAEKGNIVIDSKLGIYMLKDVADYKIWLKANKTEIAKRVASREKISFKAAKKLMEERTMVERQRFEMLCLGWKVQMGWWKFCLDFKVEQK